MPEPEEKNPADELLKVPQSEVAVSVLITQAISSTILQNQIRIIAKLEGKSEEEVGEEVQKKVEANYKKAINSLRKTI